MATWSEGEEERRCKKCGALHVVKYRDFPDRDRSTVSCLAPGCGGFVIEVDGTRDWGPARLKDPPA